MKPTIEKSNRGIQRRFNQGHDQPALQVTCPTPAASEQSLYDAPSAPDRGEIDFAAAANPTQFRDYVSMLRWKAAQWPDHKLYAFLDKGSIESEQLTHADLDLKARAIGGHLQAKHAEEQRVVIWLPSGLDYIKSFLGCLYARAMAVTLHPPFSSKHVSRIEAILEDCSARFVLTNRSIYDRFKHEIESHPTLAEMEWILVDELNDGESEQWYMPEITPDDVAYLQYTSGSTASPKGVAISHGNLVDQGEVIKRLYGLRDKEVVVTWLPHFHDMGLILFVLQSLYSSYPCYVMAPLSFVKRPMCWLTAMSKYRGTFTGGPNFAYDLAREAFEKKPTDELNLASWAIAVNGAEPVRASTLDSFSSCFAEYGFRPETCVPAYGLAEATLMVSAKPRGQATVSMDVDVAELASHRVRPGSGQAQPETD